MQLILVSLFSDDRHALEEEFYAMSKLPFSYRCTTLSLCILSMAVVCKVDVVG
jgi:hypothetical protein